jgi:hypothetical protein
LIVIDLVVLRAFAEVTENDYIRRFVFDESEEGE